MPALSSTPPHSDFPGWIASREALEASLERHPTEGPDRDDLLDQLYGLERLIIETPSEDPLALKAKAAILLWYMEMEQADGLPAMRQIASFLEGLR